MVACGRCLYPVAYAVSIVLDKVRASVAGSVVLMYWVTTNGLSPRLEEWKQWGLVGTLPSSSPERWYAEFVRMFKHCSHDMHMHMSCLCMVRW